MKEKASKDKAKGKEKAGKDEQLEEFIQVMQPRKGPSWKDVDAAPAANANGSASTLKSKKSSRYVQEDGASDHTLSGNEPASDMDWLKRHMKSSLDLSESADKAFDQSDVEMDPPTEVRLFPHDIKSDILMVLRLGCYQKLTERRSKAHYPSNRPALPS